MNNFKHRDYIYVSFLIILFLIILFSVVGLNNVNGSIVDWESQHWIIPEYFRNLFYETGDLFPSFAFNLGGGQNIYNLSYYGLLSPLTLLSYLFPNIAMVNYIQIIMIFVVISSIILMYYWLREKFDSKYAFLGTLLFLLASPLIYHTHRHIMFINYIPFLLMALIGVDRYFKNNKKTLLIISVFLIIMTSYYYSVTSLICIVLYGIYKYISLNKKITFASFMKDGLKFIFPILIGIIMSSVLLFPTFYSILNGRSDVTNSVNIFELLIPQFFGKEILYTSYGIGVTSSLILAIIYGILSSKRENKFLSIIFFLLLIFPIITYVLSGFMYARGKVLIPLLPLAIFLIITFINNVTVKKNTKFLIILSIITIIEIITYALDKEYIYIIEVVIAFISYLFYKKYGYKEILIYTFAISSLVCTLSCNYSDKLVTKNDLSLQLNTYNYTKLSKHIDDDENIYRVGNPIYGFKNVNRVSDIDYYLPSIYSSINNKYYNKFYLNNISNELENRVSTGLTSTNNIMFNTYMGVKFIVDDSKTPIGYENMKDSNIFINNNVLPIGYATSNVISNNSYSKLSYPENVYALLSNIVVENYDDEKEYLNKVVEEDINYEVVSSNLKIDKELNKYVINNNEEDGTLVLKLDKKFNNKILFISFDMNYLESCLVGDTSITINGIKNNLTCKGWTYPNKNNNFTYAISSNDIVEELNIEFTKGRYEISNINIYSLDYNYVLDVVNNVDEFKINKDKTIGDKIVGDINVNENGYFMLSIPYDKGFNVYVDGELVKYELVDNAFIGFPINEGHHDIEIAYISPYLLEGMILSITGYMIFIPIIYTDLVRRKKK